MALQWLITIFVLVRSLSMGIELPPEQSPTGNSNYGKGSDKNVKSLSTWYRFLPVSDQQGINTYLRMVSQVKSGASESIERENWETLQTSPHFSQLVSEYYLWLLKKDMDQVVDQGFRRPMLMDVNTEPGAHWKKALEISGGDTHLAARLVAILGHDDAMSLAPTVPKNMLGYESFIATKKRILKEAIEASKLKRPIVPEVLAAMEKQDPASLRVVQSSTLFAPKSLGSEIDIADSLKERIIHLQSKDGKSNTIPAKAYHFLGSVGTSCTFVEKTVLGFSAGILNPQLARMYRGMRMHGIIEDARFGVPDTDTSTISELEFKKKFVLAQKYLLKYKNVLLAPDGNMMSEKLTIYSNFRKFLKDKNMSYLAELQTNVFFENSNVDQLRKNILSKEALMDAKKMADKSFSSFAFMGYKMRFPHKPMVTTSSYNAAKAGGTHMSAATVNRCGEKNWNQAKCERAMKILESWEVDFDWSQSQHAIGSEFGLKNCRTLKAGENLDYLALQALRKRQNRSSVLGKQ